MHLLGRETLEGSSSPASILLPTSVPTQPPIVDAVGVSGVHSPYGRPQVMPTLPAFEYLVSRRITIAGGFLDFALFTANVEHLKFIIESGAEAISHYHFLYALLIISLILQV